MFGASKESRGMYGFDPTGLERAAKAASVLDKSKNSKEAYTLAMKEEEIKLVKEQRMLKEREIEMEKLQHDNKKKEIALEIEASKQKAIYDDYLAKERLVYKLNKERENNDAILKKNEESIKRQEAEKQKTLTHKHKLKIMQDKLKMENKYNAKAKAERDNIDIKKDTLKLQYKEERDTKIKLRDLTLNAIGNGISKLLKDKVMFNRLIFGITSAFIVSYTMKKAISISFDIIKSKLMTPKLVKETSRNTISNIKNILIKRHNQKMLFKGLFFNNILQNQLDILSKSLINQRIKNKSIKNKIPLRNFLFYGPPGTGKTAFAKSLAIKSGIDYAILTGADISPLGNKGVVELNKVFDWANTSRKGVLIFIDESDAFLRKRTNGINERNLSEDLRNSLNLFLYRTGIQTRKFFFVLATNEPQLLDSAVLDRIDEIVCFELPQERERKKILIDNAERSFDSDNVKVFKDNIERIVRETKEFSGRELAKFTVGLYYKCLCDYGNKLNGDLIYKTIEQVKREKRIKREWNDIQNEKNKIKH